MFLHAGAVLDSGWIEETTQFIERVSASGRPRAGIFRYARSPYAETSLRDAFKYLARMLAGPIGRTGPADRPRPLRAARRLRAGWPPLRGAAAAATGPLLAHPAAQPDHRRLTARGLANYLILSNNLLMKSSASSDGALDGQIATVRGFSGFYTRKPGIIEPKLLDSPFTLQEARIIYEIAQLENCTATDLVRSLGLDAGFLSRTLAALQRRQIVARKPSKIDRRANELVLTAKGRAAFAELENRSRREVAALLDELDDDGRARVVGAMAAIEQTLEPPAQKPAGFLLRSHRPGDIGWVVSRHGAVYAQEYGWDISFEALVAEIGAQFFRNFDASREHCWIAEVGGEPVGSIFLVRGSDEVAKIACCWWRKSARARRRPHAGRAMHPFCQRRRLRLDHAWTQSILVAARGIYARAGFEW